MIAVIKEAAIGIGLIVAGISVVYVAACIASLPFALAFNLLSWAVR